MKVSLFHNVFPGLTERFPRHAAADLHQFVQTDESELEAGIQILKLPNPGGITDTSTPSLRELLKVKLANVHLELETRWTAASSVLGRRRASSILA